MAASRVRRFTVPLTALLVLIATMMASPSHANARPSLASFSPASGPVGTKLSIRGSGLANVTGVRIGGRAARFHVAADDLITATVPPGASDGPVTLSWGGGGVSGVQRFDSTLPNIVLILTDDQTVEELNSLAMPTVMDQIVNRGTRFANGFVVNPLCCPSRTTILTGKYSHGTDVYDNTPPHGGFSTFGSQDQSTIATWLHAAGYRTALVGKYLNGYKPGSYVAPGWDTWDALLLSDGNTGGYYDYSMSINGKVRRYGGGDSNYATDVISAYATDFIRSVPHDQPLFLEFTPHAPHAPATPSRRYANYFSSLSPLRPPNYNETDVSDKPQWVRQLKPLTSNQQHQTDEFRKNQYRTLRSVDDAVGDILQQLWSSGRLSTTFILFASDNGMEQGSHRWTAKQVVWDEAARVPIVVRYDPLTQGDAGTDTNLVLNLDFAPTFAALAGVSAPGSEGLSLLPLLEPDPPTLRDDFLIEHWGGGTVPAYCAVRTQQYKYVEYATGEEELYDLNADRYELQSRDKDEAYAATKAALHARLLQLCSPPPPGFVP
jgi:N-acetylglucosamine-6-sulfatase